MANSPLVSIRVPPEILSRIDQLAEKLYPPRRAGKMPNRSQVILDAIDLFLKQHETIEPEPFSITGMDEPSQDEFTPSGLPAKAIDPACQEASLSYPTDYLPIHSSYSEPLIRQYIDWWFDYFSYIRKLSDGWIDPE